MWSSAGDAEVGDRITSRSRLNRTPIYHDELWPIRKPFRTRGGRDRFLVNWFVVLRRSGLLDEPTESTSDYLGHRGWIVSSWALDREASVVARSRHAVFEDHHGRHGVAARQM